MGLDMYVYAVDKERVIDDTNFFVPVKSYDNDLTEIFYWRKHNYIHSWFELLWEEKLKRMGRLAADSPAGSQYQDFDCEYIRIDLADLDRLEKCIRKKNMPFIKGGFLMTCNPTEAYDDEDKAYDLKFIEKARHYIATDIFALYYYSWW